MKIKDLISEAKPSGYDAGFKDGARNVLRYMGGVGPGQDAYDRGYRDGQTTVIRKKATKYSGEKAYTAHDNYKGVDEAAPEWIKHPTVKGVQIKNPRWTPSMKEPRAPASGLNRSEAMKARHAAHKAKIDKLYHEVWMAVGNSFPDGDPHDEAREAAIQIFGLDEWDDAYKYINAAVYSHHPEYKTLSDWMASMWDDYAADSMHDAKSGYGDDNSPFYRRGENGEIEPEANPWR